jgi:hypothetical protein
VPVGERRGVASGARVSFHPILESSARRAGYIAENDI